MPMRILYRLSQGDRYSNKLMAMDLGIDEATVEQWKLTEKGRKAVSRMQ